MSTCLVVKCVFIICMQDFFLNLNSSSFAKQNKGANKLILLGSVRYVGIGHSSMSALGITVHAL